MSFTVSGVNYNIISGTNVQVALNTTYAFSSITIPATVVNNSIQYTITGIVDLAFQDNNNIITVAFLAPLTSIGGGTFYNCNSLQTITVPSTLTSIGSGTFYNCISLQTINLSNCPSLSSIGGNTFQNSGLTNINLSNNTSLTTLGLNAFALCTSLTSILLPNSLISTGNSSLYGCSNLGSIIHPSSLQTISPSTHQLCTKLLSVTFLGLTIPTFGSNSFTKNAGSTAYYQYNTVNPSALLTSNYFFNYVRLDLPIPCFKENSLILTHKGYVKVENLKKGDLVKTLNDGYKPIYMIGKKDIYHSALKDRIKDQLYKCNFPEYPEIIEPLILTGCHCILVEEFENDKQRDKTKEINGDIYITDNLYRLPACVDKKASVYEIPGNYIIYHFALENDDIYMNYGIFANGLLVETCSQRYLSELSGMIII